MTESFAAKRSLPQHGQPLSAETEIRATPLYLHSQDVVRCVGGETYQASVAFIGMEFPFSTRYSMVCVQHRVEWWATVAFDVTGIATWNWSSRSMRWCGLKVKQSRRKANRRRHAPIYEYDEV